MAKSLLSARRIVGVLVATLAVVGCAGTGPHVSPTPVELQPFRAALRMAMSNDGSTLVGAGNVALWQRIDRVMAWKVPNFERVMQSDIALDDLATMNAGYRPAIAVSADGTLLAYSDRIDSLLVQDLNARSDPKRFSFEQRWIAGAMWFRGSGQQLLVLLHSPGTDAGGDSNDFMVELANLDLESGEIRRRELGVQYRWLASYGLRQRAAFRAEHPAEAIANVTLSPRGNSMAFFRMPEGKMKGRIEVWDIDAWRRTLVADFPYGLGSLFFSNNDRYLAIVSTAAHDSHGTDSNWLRVIDVQNEQVILDVETVGKPNHSYAATFSPDSSQLATGTRCTGFQLWDLTTRGRVGHARIGGCMASAMTTGLAYSANGRHLFVGTDKGDIRLVEIDRFLD